MSVSAATILAHAPEQQAAVAAFGRRRHEVDAAVGGAQRLVPAFEARVAAAQVARHARQHVAGARTRHLGRLEAFDLLARGRRDQPFDVLVVEGLTAGDGVEEVPVDANHEVPGKVHPLHGDLGPCADRDPDGRARDRDARAAFEHGVQVVSARVSAPGATQSKPVAQQRTDQRGVGRPAPVQPAARAQLACELVEALEPAIRFHTRAIVGSEPEGALGDIAITRGAFEHRLARLQSLHGR